jgi:hypothetical protein
LPWVRNDVGFQRVASVIPQLILSNCLRAKSFKLSAPLHVMT